MRKVGICAENVAAHLRKHAGRIRPPKEIGVACEAIQKYVQSPDDTSELRFLRSVENLCANAVLYRMVMQNTQAESWARADMKRDCTLTVCHALEIAHRRVLPTGNMETEASWLDSIV